MSPGALPHLETFVEAAERGSFTAAARELGVSQAAVSQRVQQLEAAVSCSLFRRAEGRATLTEAGRTLHDYARRILALHDDARAALGGLRPVVAGELLLAASSVPGDHLLPGLLAAFHAKHPRVRARVEGGDTGTVLRLVEQGRAHVGLAGGRTDAAHLDFRPFARDRLVIVVPPGDPWRRRRSVTPAQLAARPLVLREGGSGSRWSLERAVAPAKLTMALELGSNEAVKEAVAAGVGPAVLSELAVRRDVEAGRLHALTVAGLDLERPLFVVTDSRRALPPAARAFLAHLGV
jgi:DNA-binding transcriptional LysR family regulator